MPVTHPRSRAAYVAAALLLLALNPARGETLSIEVIEPRSVPAESLVPILAPFVAPPGSVQAFQGKLVVRATTAGRAEIRSLLRELDRAPRNLLITVRHGTAVDRRLDRIELGGGRDENGVSTAARVLSTRSGGDERDLQRLRVLEGVPAFVSTGLEVPVAERSVILGTGGATVQDTVRYRPADSGFYVRARISGGRARVEISAERTRVAGAHGGVFETSSARTTVTAALGEWIELGGNIEHAERDDARIIARTRSARRANRQIYLRVDLAD